MVEQTNLGNVKVSNEVIATIAAVAATQVEGVVGMSEGIINGIAKIISGSQLTKGVKVEVGDDEVNLDVSIIIKYGTSIPDIAGKVQENIKKAVENMTGLKTVRVNLYIQGVHVEEATKNK
ncbi:MAG: Asp23/Gls24 family envelope stress response protein [bacterium]